MAFSPPPPQESFLYNNGWSQEMDHFFIGQLVHHKGERKWQGLRIPDDVLMAVLNEVNLHFRAKFSFHSISLRADTLLQRYKTFKKLRRFHDDAFWHRGEGVVVASDKIWAQLFKRNAFARAYYHSAEPEFNRLAILFGLNDVKVEGESNIIVLSDNTQALDEKNEDEEVTSPIPISARRRLFDDISVASELSSTKMDFAPSNAFPPAYNDTSENMVNEPNNGTSSSCASCSPLPFWKY